MRHCIFIILVLFSSLAFIRLGTKDLLLIEYPIQNSQFFWWAYIAVPWNIGTGGNSSISKTTIEKDFNFIG